MIYCNNNKCKYNEYNCCEFKDNLILNEIGQCTDFDMKDNWISVNENLPIIPIDKINEGYNRKQILVTVKTEPKIKIAWFEIEDNKFYDDSGFLSEVLEDVIAWQELPKAYKG